MRTKQNCKQRWKGQIRIKLYRQKNNHYFTRTPRRFKWI